ncbi:MAG: hypothetical protein RLZ25_1002 [Pseudomonadota bacterium]
MITGYRRLLPFSLMLAIAGGYPPMVSAEASTPQEETLEEFTEDAWTGKKIPDDERRFIEISASAQNAVRNGKDETRVRAARKDALSQGFAKTHFERWAGILEHAPDDGGDGYIALFISIAPNITLKTDLNIKPGSLIQKAVSNLPYGTKVEFSGDFVRDVKGKDYFEETSFTTGGSLTDPAWRVVIDGLKALD